MALVPPQVNPALRDGVCPRSPGKSWVLAARFPPLYPIPRSEPALAHAPPLLSRRFFCTTWRQGTCRTRWVPQPRAHGGSSWLRDPLNHTWIFIHATPHGKAAFVQGTTEQLCPGDHSITQKTAFLCLMSIPSHVPTLRFYLQSSHLGSWRDIRSFLSGCES